MERDWSFMYSSSIRDSVSIIFYINIGVPYPKIYAIASFKVEVEV